MKKIILLSILSLSALSSDAALFYTSGPQIGKLVKHTGYLGYEDACYKGNAWKARKLLLKMANEDYEKEGVKAWYNQKSKNIEFSFVDTKCLDDSLDATAEECTTEVEITKC